MRACLIALNHISHRVEITYKGDRPERQTCVGTVMASLMRGSEELQSASCPACAGSACRKSLTSGCAACSSRSSPVKLTYAPWRCSRLLRMLSRSACNRQAMSGQDAHFKSTRL